jgi:hypothetical protein
MPQIGAALGTIVTGIGAAAAGVGSVAVGAAGAAGSAAAGLGRAAVTGIGATAAGALTLGGQVVGMAGNVAVGATKAAGVLGTAIVKNAEPISKILGTGITAYQTYQQLTGKVKTNQMPAAGTNVTTTIPYATTSPGSVTLDTGQSASPASRQLDATQILLFAAAGLFAFLLVKRK